MQRRQSAPAANELGVRIPAVDTRPRLRLRLSHRGRLCIPFRVRLPLRAFLRGRAFAASALIPFGSFLLLSLFLLFSCFLLSFFFSAVGFSFEEWFEIDDPGLHVRIGAVSDE